MSKFRVLPEQLAHIREDFFAKFNESIGHVDTLEYLDTHKILPRPF